MDISKEYKGGAFGSIGSRIFEGDTNKKEDWLIWRKKTELKFIPGYTDFAVVPGFGQTGQKNISGPWTSGGRRSRQD